MAAPKGNQFWKTRSSHGRNPIFPTPDALWDAACEYFQWVEDNPLWEDRLVTFQGNWFSPIEKTPGVDVKDPIEVSTKMLRLRRDDADLSVDLTGGWGSGVRSHLINNQNIDCAGIVYSQASGARTVDGKFGFKNLRAELWWKLREALDPEGGTDEKLMLPPSTRLKAELTTPRWSIRGTDILIESKEDIKKRIGGSTDEADVVAQLWHRKDHAVMRAVLEKAPPGGWQSVADDENLLDAW